MESRDLLAVLLTLRPSDMPPELIHDRPDWHRKAACRGVGPDVFFIEKGQSTGPAKALCDACEVRTSCADAGQGEEFGVWAGMAPRARKALRRSAA